MATQKKSAARKLLDKLSNEPLTERAARWARVLGYSEAQFVRLALQAEVDAAGLKYRVQLKAA